MERSGTDGFETAADMTIEKRWKEFTRRKFLADLGTGLGAVALLERAAVSAPNPPAGPVANGRRDPVAARHTNERTDNDLVATLGTCYQNDFRFFTMLRQEAWDFLRWETLGNAVLEHRSWNNWPYEQRLRVQVNDAEISSDSLRPDQVEHQFDFRRVKVSLRSVNIERLDMIVSARQWTTALRLNNPLNTGARIVVQYEWTGRNKEPLDVRPWPDQDDKGFVYAITNGPPILVTIGANGTYERKGDTTVVNRWEVDLKAGETTTLDLDVHIGWASLSGHRDKGPGERSTDKQAAIDRRADREGFRRVMTELSVSSVSNHWADLQTICEARRHYLYDRMPRLQGFEPEWVGFWSYTFDLIRSGTYPAQGHFKDVWMVADLVIYREPFSWDGPASVHTFCHWDADIAARTLRTYLRGATQADGELSVSSNPYRSYPNPTPQLANNTMALWDCYQITRDPALLADCYPLLVRHVRWLESKRNRTPNGPLMDIGYNIDYGPASLYESPTIWPDVQFFLVDHYRKLGQIARAIGKPENEQAEWTDKASRLAKAVREHMWDDRAGTFWCVSDKLEFKPVASPIEFHGMATGVSSVQQSRRLLTRLKDPAKYAPSAQYPYGLPSAPFDSPLFVVKDSWSGTIWPIQTYYTVRGLADCGYQDEAAALSTNLYGMMSRDYLNTGTVWEQYDPRTGKDLDSTTDAKGAQPDVGRGHFVSGIATSVADALLRGLFGFERTDEPTAFYLTPRPLAGDWHGVENLRLSGDIRLAIQTKEDGAAVACKVKFSGVGAGTHSVTIHGLDLDDSAKKLVQRIGVDEHQEITVNLPKSNGIRYLWNVIPCVAEGRLT